MFLIYFFSFSIQFSISTRDRERFGSLKTRNTQRKKTVAAVSRHSLKINFWVEKKWWCSFIMKFLYISLKWCFLDAKKDGSGISRIKIDSQHTHTGIILQKTNFCFQMDRYFLFSIPSHNHHHHVQPIIISIHLDETKEKIQT